MSLVFVMRRGLRGPKPCRVLARSHPKPCRKLAMPNPKPRRSHHRCHRRRPMMSMMSPKSIGVRRAWWRVRRARFHGDLFWLAIGVVRGAGTTTCIGVVTASGNTVGAGTLATLTFGQGIGIANVVTTTCIGGHTAIGASVVGVGQTVGSSSHQDSERRRSFFIYRLFKRLLLDGQSGFCLTVVSWDSSLICTKSGSSEEDGYCNA